MPETLSDTASLSKVVLAAAVHEMAGESLVNLDRLAAGKFAFTHDAAKVSPSRATFLQGKLTAHREAPRLGFFHGTT